MANAATNGPWVSSPFSVKRVGALAGHSLSPPRANHTHPDICTYDYTVNRACRPTRRNLTISDSNNNMGVNGSHLSVLDIAVNLGAAYPITDTQQDSGSHTNSPNCTYFHCGCISADFQSPWAAVYDHGDVVIETEITNCHSKPNIHRHGS